MEPNKKVTKKDNFNVLLAILEAAKEDNLVISDDEITYESLTEFINGEIELLDKKAASAKKRAAVKKAQGDPLRDRVLSVLTDEPQPIGEILKALGDPDISTQMVVSRLTQLCSENIGKAVKESIKVEPAKEGRKPKTLNAYRRA